MVFGSTYKNIFALLIFMSIACVIFQYRFNFSSISQCLSNQNRFVATRVVERVYFEMPPGAPTTPSLNTFPPSRNADTTIPENDGLLMSPNPVTESQGMEPVTEMPSGHTEIIPNTTKLVDTCSPGQYVLFLKTHKTGSSTITNILNRFADWNDLSMLLPKNDDYYSFDWPNKFRLNFAKNLHGRRPNILANHARYSRKAMNALFPREKTFYVTVLRHPVKQWESTFNYMSFPYILNILKKDDPLDFFLKNPPSFQNLLEIGRRYPSLYLIKNPQFFDLGLDYKYYDNKTMIRRAIRTVERDFNLVLLMEYFDESLTLLKRRLCWDIDDVVYFKMNERLNKNKRKKLTKEQKKKILHWNNADVALYDYFSKQFWLEVQREGPGFYEDLQKLKERKEYYHKTCIEKEAIEEAYTAVFVKGFAMRKNLTGYLKTFCERMLRNELNYQDIFKSRYKNWVEALGGSTIENFDESTEEADVTVVDPISVKKDGEGYRYVRPTRVPKTTKRPKATTLGKSISSRIKNETSRSSPKGESKDYDSGSASRTAEEDSETESSSSTNSAGAAQISETSSNVDKLRRPTDTSSGDRNWGTKEKDETKRTRDTRETSSLAVTTNNPSHDSTEDVRSGSPDLPYEDSSVLSLKPTKYQVREKEVVNEVEGKKKKTDTSHEDETEAIRYDGKTNVKSRRAS